MARDSIPLLLAGDGAVACRAARDIRDRLILEAHQAGWSYRRIGEVTGIPHKTVERIVTRTRARREEAGG